MTADTLEATNKNIEEKSNIFMRSLDEYITKKILDDTLKIVAISIVILAKLNNSGGTGRGM